MENPSLADDGKITLFSICFKSTLKIDPYIVVLHTIQKSAWHSDTITNCKLIESSHYVGIETTNVDINAELVK